MKNCSLLLTLFFISIYCVPLNAQDSTRSLLEKESVTDQVLKQISKESENRAKELETQIGLLNTKIKDIDKTLNQSLSEGEAITQLRERVKVLEERQDAERVKEISIYTANYQTAVINLVSMERELRPLQLFQASQEFYTELNDISNPMTYDGFNKWYQTFYNYLEDNKQNDAIVQVTLDALNTAGDFSKNFGLSGAISTGVLLSVSRFVESLSNKKDRKLRDQSVEMMQLITILSQYSADKNEIETEWNNIAKDLDELQRLQEATLNEVLADLGINKSELNQKYLQETNASNSLEFLNHVKDLAAKRVNSEIKNNSENWKDQIYLDMQTVQSLKVRFGQSTAHIHGNLGRYEELIDRYATNPLMKGKISDLQTKWLRLNKTFDTTFNPQKYISDAVRMYQIH